MGTSAINWSKVTGQSIDEVAQNFNDLAKNPVQAVKKLDDQLHFLTAAQYANIQSLQEQGRTMDAARVATEAYADALDGRSKEMERNLGYVETAWNSVAAAAKGAWDAMLNVGRPTSIDDQIAEIERKLAQPKFGLLTSDADFDRSKQLLREQLDFLKAKKEAQEYDAKYFAEQNKIQEAGKKFVDATNSAYNSTLPQVKKLQDLLDNLKKQHDENAKNGVVDAVTETKYATARKNIEQQIADIKEREAKKNAPKGQNKGVAEADNTASRLLAQYDPAAQAARTLTKEESQLQLALSKGKITREEYGKALAQASLNYAAAIKGAQGLTAAEQYQAQLERQLLIQREQYAAQAAAVGMGTQEAQRYQQRLQLEQQTNDRILQLRTELAQATTEKQRQELQAQIDLTNEYLPQQIAAMQQGWAQMDAAMANPINGWTAAVQNFGTQAANVAGQVQSTFETAFGTLTNGLTEKITSLDLSLKSLGEVGMDAIRGIISSFVKMGVQMGANALLAMTLGASQTTATVAMAGTTAAAWAPAAAMASLATLGGNSVPAATALTSTTALASTLAAIPGLATGGMVNGTGTGTSDSNLRWLSNGEFVVNAEATRRNRALLEAINSNDRTPVSAGRGASSSPAIAAAPTVNLYEDSSKAGSVNTRTADDGSQAIDIWVASIMGDGKAHKAMQQKYGLRTAGT
jgi:phage-related minor tail protein